MEFARSVVAAPRIVKGEGGPGSRSHYAVSVKLGGKLRVFSYIEISGVLDYLILHNALDLLSLRVV